MKTTERYQQIIDDTIVSAPDTIEDIYYLFRSKEYFGSAAYNREDRKELKRLLIMRYNLDLT